MDAKTPTSLFHAPTIVAVIPCFRVKEHVLEVIRRVGKEVAIIICVDDACPDGSGHFIQDQCADSRVTVIFHDRNLGVGGATLTGYQRALDLGAEIVVKLDGDGQMAPEMLPLLVAPILHARCDYAKGNRFFNIGDVAAMPWLRLFGNAVLSFLTKVATGYWHVFDPTNGYTAIHAAVLRNLRRDKIALGYFFESSMLFELGLLRAVVCDVPMVATYGQQRSNLSIPRVILPFLFGNLRNTARRIIYNYFLRGFSLASMLLALSPLLMGFSVAFGGWHWYRSLVDQAPATAGTVMLAALPLLVGLEFLLSVLNYDISAVPSIPIHPLISTAIRSAPEL